MDCEGREEVADHRVVPSLFPSFMRPLKRGVEDGLADAIEIAIAALEALTGFEVLPRLKS